MSASVRFLHTADLHLGIPVQGFSGASRALENRLMEASFEAWRRICDAALVYDVDFVLVAGDLYHQEARSVKAARCLQEEVRRLDEAGIDVYAVYGNHDPLGDRHELLDMPKNFHACPADELGFYEIEKGGVTVARILGVSYKSRREARPLHAMFSPPDDAAINIGLLHTALDPKDRNYVPCSMQDLLNQHYMDYWALGHVHQPRIIRSGLPTIAYPGTPQGRHPGEQGVGGCLLVELSQGKAGEMKFVPISPYVWMEIEIAIDEPWENEPIMNLSDLERLLRGKAEQLLEEEVRMPDIPLADTSWQPEGYLVRWVLTGRGPVHELLAEAEEESDELLYSLREFQEHRPFLWTESIQIQTGPALPKWDDMMESWPLARQLKLIAESCLSDAKLRKQLDNALGQIWETNYDPEHPNETKLAATPEVVAGIIEQAKELAYEKLLEGVEVQ
ncbi:MAG: DNA repair exonuclease [Firmicutes bacterium]|jgi:DNA repair exonuclease SbcCD nuclease subunit|nr:DNA repair exonuclease [Bacillota bacterium]NLY52452.1 DNA repair exonuclease [Bacillota bacterium]